MASTASNQMVVGRPGAGAANAGLVRRVAVALWLLLVVLLLCGTRAVWPEEALKSLDEVVAALPRFDVSGKVLDMEGKPLPGAEIWLYYSHGKDGLRDRLAGRTKTDANGAYRFDKAIVWEPVTDTKTESPPKYAVIAKHPDHGIYFTILLQGDPLENVVVKLHGLEFGKNQEKAQTITVLDDKLTSLPSARVYLCGGKLLNADGESLSSDRQYLRVHKDIGVSSGVTDEKGQVTLIRPPGPNFWVEKEGYVKGWAPAKRCVMFPAAQVSGRVTYPDGTPAAGAAVWFEYRGQGLVDSDVRVTDKDGRYTFNDVPGAGFRFTWMKSDSEKGAQGTATLKVEDLRPGSPFAGKAVSFPINLGDKLTKDLTFEPACVLSGKVVDLTTNQSVPELLLDQFVQVPGQAISDWRRLKTDDKGEFHSVLATGSQLFMQWNSSDPRDSYIIDEEWENQDNHQALKNMTVTKNVTGLVLNVKLWPVQPLKGKVVDEKGQPVAKADVHLHPDARWVTTDANGEFTIKVAPKDRDFDLLAITKDKKLAGLAHCKKGATEATVRVEPTRDYEGQALNTDGMPAGNLKFYMDMKLNDRSNLWVRWEPKTDAEGRFSVKSIYPKGIYYVWWSADNEDNRDYDYGNAAVDLTKVKEGQPIIFAAKQFLNALMGIVVDKGGNPIAGARIEVTSQDMLPQSGRSQQIVSNAKGEFTIERLAPGEVSLCVTAQGYKTRTIVAPTDSVDFKAVMKSASAGGNVVHRVTVKDEAGKPVRAPVSFWITQSGWLWGTTTNVLTAVTDANGDARFTRKSSGRSKGAIGCDMEGYDVTCQSVLPDQDTEIALVLRRSSDHPRGVVVDQEGKPIEGAAIRVTGLQPAGLRGAYGAQVMLEEYVPFSVQTDRDGRFELSRFNLKDWINVGISAKGYERKNDYFDGRGSKEKTFVLSPAAK